MFAKPFSLILVYIITIFNIVILLAPLLGMALPFISFENNIIKIEQNAYQYLKYSFFVTCFAVSFLMLIYLALDFLFGFSVRSSLKGCLPYEKVKGYDFLTELLTQVKYKFGEKNVKLYIKNSDEINAFAISSFGRKYIVVTGGLINHYLKECEESKDFLYALRSIIGHEMSHLVNKDFLPSFLIITNQRITNLISHFFYIIFNFVIVFLSRLPTSFGFMSNIMARFYGLLNFVLNFFNRFIVYNIYEFLRRFISRSIEYRCDMQSAKAFGGNNMAVALSMLGESGYFTLFSTHPATKRRVNKVKDIKITDSIVKPRFLDALANYFSLMFLMVICLYFAKHAKIDMLVRSYLENHEVIHNKVAALWRLISNFF